MRDHQPDEAMAKAEAEWVFAFGEPTRLRIIRALVTGEKCVTELAKLLRVEVVLVSQHLGVLRENGVVTVRRDGRFKLYSVAGGTATAMELQMTHESGIKVIIPLN